MTWDIAPAADIVTQPFGCVDYSGEWPCPGCGSGHFHAGIDLGSSAGGQSIFRTSVKATRSGTVSAIGIQYLGDQAVAVKTDQGVTIEHGHLDQTSVQVGQRVNIGDELGLLGTKGASTAPHLHVEVRVDGPFQGVSGCPQNDPTRDPVPYLNKVAPMIAGLDSSGFRPTAQQALTAKAGGVGLWSGYLATKNDVGLAASWSQTDFDNARLCGGKPLAYCSGRDDPVACRKLADAWDVRLCLDVEDGIRGDGAWVQPWIDSAGRDACGLYGNYWVFAGKQAAFYVVGGYPGADPQATWGYVTRPSGPCGWQWWGTHDEYGGGVDRGWFEDWFAQAAPVQEEVDMKVVTIGSSTSDRHGPGAVYLVGVGLCFYLGNPIEVSDWLRILNQKEILPVSQYTIDRLNLLPRVDDTREAQLPKGGELVELSGNVKAIRAQQSTVVDIKALATEIVAELPHNANEAAIADLVVTKLGEHLNKPAA